MVFICQYVGCSLFSDVEFELNEDVNSNLKSAFRCGSHVYKTEVYIVSKQTIS
jgi:hypothetical protein